MAFAERSFHVATNIDDAWDFVSDMGNWATQMPGYLSHEELDRDRSIWRLQVDFGPFQRQVAVAIEVTEWNAPTSVTFEIAGKTEPFTGGGRYEATSDGDRTDIVLTFNAEPGGAMAKMINALAGPVLERVADQFSTNLRLAIDGGEQDIPCEGQAVPPLFRRLIGWMSRLIGRSR